MKYGILGPLIVWLNGGEVPIGAARQRALLTQLLLRRGELVPTETLVDELWEERPPATAVKIVQTYVSQLRKVLGEGALETRPAGYLLRLEPGALDAELFEGLLASGRGLLANGDAGEARESLREALGLWRGPPLVEFRYEAFAREEISRLEELRLIALEQLLEADLALGRHAEAVPELETLVREHPRRENLRRLLMLALYRAGRQADALCAYQDARTALVEELGLDPSESLQQLEKEILRHDAALDLPVGADSPVPSAEAAVSLSGGLTPSHRRHSTSFVGREHELREIRALLTRSDVRLLTLTGPPGAGKTRLAVEVSAGLGGEFADGATLVELAPISDPGLVTLTIANSLGVSEIRGRSLVETIAASLHGRPVLLVLDNLEQVLQAAPLLAELLQGAPTVKMLVTSRAPLDIPEERIYEVPALRLPDPSARRDLDGLRRTESVRLFIDRARDARADFEFTEENADAVAELCLRLDGLPLPLELASARIRLLSPGAILERLGQKLELLKAAPGSGAPARHRTLRSAIEWSYDLLTAEEQVLFTSLAVFVGGFTLDAADAVAGSLDLDLVEGVESLLTNSLLKTERINGDEARFGMLETIREYGLERLEERGDGESVRRRHASFFLVLAEQAEPALLGPQQMQWLRRLDRERSNLRAALTWACERGEAEVGLRTAAALWRFWQLRASEREGRAYLDKLLAGHSGSPSTRAKAQLMAAALAHVEPDHAAVRRYLEASIPVHRRLGNDDCVARGLLVLGATRGAEGATDEARALLEEARETARRAGDLATEANCLAQLGVLVAVSGELDDAKRLLEESIVMAGTLGNTRGVGNWSRALGGVARLRKDYPEARRLLEESLAINRSLDDAWGLSGSLSTLALLALEEQDIESAKRLLDQSLELQRNASYPHRVASSLELSARLAVTQDHPARAARLYGASSLLRESAGADPCEVGWPDHAPEIAGIRVTLDAQDFETAWAQGRAMSIGESITFALEDEADSHARPWAILAPTSRNSISR